MNLLEIKKVNKKFGDKQILHDINLVIPRYIIINLLYKI